MEIVLGLIILALYGWYMLQQGKARGHLAGVLTGGAVVLCSLVMQDRMTRPEAKLIMPSLTDEVIDAMIKQIKELKDASVQSKKHTD